MKKFVAAILVMVVILMSLVAQAEAVDIRDWRVSGEEDGKVTYYVTYAAEDGTEKEFPVSEEVFETAVYILHERRAEEAKQEQIREYQADRGSWVKDACAWVSFWNPND